MKGALTQGSGWEGTKAVALGNKFLLPRTVVAVCRWKLQRSGPSPQVDIARNGHFGTGTEVAVAKPKEV